MNRVDAASYLKIVNQLSQMEYVIPVFLDMLPEVNFVFDN